MKTFPRPRAALLCAACVFSFFLPNPSFAAETVASLLAKHRAAATSPSAAKVTTQKAIYDIAAGPLVGTLTEYESLPGKSRVEMNLGPIQSVTGDDGKVAWEQTGGLVRVVRGPELTEKRAAAFSIETFDPMKNGKTGKVTLRPERDKASGAYILDVDPTGGVRQTIFLNAKTYLVDKVITRQNGMSGTITIQAYKTIDGVPVPAKMQIGYAGVPLVVQATLKEAKRGLPLAASLFSVPGNVKSYDFLAAAPVKIEFADENNEIVVSALVKGKPCRFLLDSGAGPSFVTAGAAKRLGLTTKKGLPAIGYGGAAQTSLASDTTIEFPEAVRLKSVLLYVLDDSHVTEALTTRGRVDGVLGGDIFSRFTVTIDYDAHAVTFADNAQPAVADKNAVVLPIKLENRSPIVEASLDGKKPARFLVDTGDNSSVHLFGEYARANNLLRDTTFPGAQVQMGMGVGGVVTQVVTSDHTLALGATTLADVPVATLSGTGINSLSDRAGGIGNLVLRKFVPTFDYAHLQLILTPSATFTPSLRLTRPLPPKPGGPLVPTSTRIAPFPFSQFSANVMAAFFQTENKAELTQAEVLEKHLNALGGRDAVEKIKSTRVTAAVTTGGLTGSVITIFGVPDKEYEEDKIGVFDITQGYDGKTAWRRDSNGNVRPLGPDETRALRTQLFFDTNSYIIPGRIKGTLTLRPEREAGTGNYVLDAKPEGGKPSVLFLDPKTFLIAKEQHQDDNVTQTTTFEDYRAVDGVQFPFKQTATNGTARYDISVTASKIENNVAVPDSLFALPGATKNFGFVKPGVKSATVPIEIDDGEIALNVKINGQPARVYLDSGAAGIALSKTVAQSLNLPLTGFLEARGYGGSTDLHPVKITTFEVPGAVKLTDIAAVAIPLPDFAAITGKPLAGFVGYDLLTHFVVKLDYAKKTVTFIDPAAFTPTKSDGVGVPIDLDNDLPTLTAKLDNLPSATYLVDTGDAAALRLYGPYVAQNKLTQKYPKGRTAYGGGIGGLSASRETRTQLFSVAGVTLRGVPTEFSLDQKGGASELYAGSLGSGVLSRFVLTFDYPNHRIFFAPNAQTTRAFETRSTGIVVVSDDGRRKVVADILDGAPARRQGLKPGDVLVKIDGQNADALSLGAVRRLLSPESGKKSHLLLVRAPGGRTRTVQADLFDPLG